MDWQARAACGIDTQSGTTGSKGPLQLLSDSTSYITITTTRLELSLSLTIVSRKRVHGRYVHFFATKKHPCLHYHNLQQDISSVCISQACVASHKWTSGSSVLTFQEKDSKLHASLNFTGKPSHVERIFQKLPE